MGPSTYLAYNRENKKASWFRTKEWDNYVVNHPDYNFSVTIADVGYLGLVTFEIVDYKEQKVYADGLQKFFTKGQWALPVSSQIGDIEFYEERFYLKITRMKDKRKIEFNFPTFDDRGLSGNITMFQDPTKDSIVKVNRYKKKKLFCARDHFGIRPLFYYESEDLFAFSTEVKGLLELSKVPVQVDESWIAEHSATIYSEQFRTPYKNIYRLEPAYHVEVGRGEIEFKKYWVFFINFKNVASNDTSVNKKLS